MNSSSKSRPKKFVKGLQRNINGLQDALAHTDDLIIRKFTVRLQQGQEIPAALVYLDGLVSGETVNMEVLRPILIEARKLLNDVGPQLLTYLQSSIITSREISESSDFDKALLGIMSGETVMLLDGVAHVLVINTKGFELRGVESPQTEAVVRGPRDSFTETLSPNLMLIRRRLRDPHLVFKRLRLGQRGKNDVVVAYIEDVADQAMVNEALERLKKVDLDVILDSGYVEQIIEDNWWSPFNTIQETERPDEAVAGLAEGRVCILVDNTPFVLLIPSTLNTQMISPEDYYLRWPAVIFVRLIRFFASFVAIVTPALYIAIIAYHPEMLPTELALAIAGAREAIPFPSFLEAIIMEISIELLREAGIRLPGPIGQTIGIVGGLIIGDAAVRANLVSPVMVIVVALTAIASFVIPTYTFSIGVRLVRFLLMLLASALGLYGVTLGALLVLGHLASLSSFGVSYLSPWAPLSVRDLKDSVIRLPWHLIKSRPAYTGSLDKSRQPIRSQKARRKRRR